MNQNLWEESEQEELEETDGEAPSSPVVSQFHSLQAVHLELNLAVKVHFMESLHWNLVLSAVLLSILGVLETKVVLDTLSRELDLFVDTATDTGESRPEGHENWDSGQGSEEEEGPETSSNLVLEVVWDNEENTNHQKIVKGSATGTFCWERSILDAWVLLVSK